jgi:hypothetical protein
LHDVEDGQLDPLAPRSVEEVWYGRGAPPITSSQSDADLKSPRATGKQTNHISRVLSASQDDVNNMVSPASPSVRRHLPGVKTASHAAASQMLKVDAGALIKWGKGKNEEYRRGLLMYRVIILKRLISEYLGIVPSGFDHVRMDVGITQSDISVESKEALKLIGLLGVGTEEYDCLMRDLQDLMLPDFEINLRRKIDTATRMQQTYRCFSTM